GYRSGTGNGKYERPYRACNEQRARLWPVALSGVNACWCVHKMKKKRKEIGTMMDQQNLEQSSQGATYDVRFLCRALQQLQVLFGFQPTAFYDPSLADVVNIIHVAQARFGQDASLESAIQALAVEDTARQVTEEILTLVRNRRQASAGQASAVACQAVSIL